MKTTEITFKDCWVGPYSVLGPYIVDVKGNMILLCLDNNEITSKTEKLMSDICDKLNGNKTDTVFTIEDIDDTDPCLLVINNWKFHLRGWQYLTAYNELNLPTMKAEEIQDELREWIVNTLQN